MRIMVLGGDGYLGWPTSMHLSAQGHEVIAVDNYLRRNLSRNCNAEPLNETPNLHERAKIWNASSGHTIAVEIGDLCDWDFVEPLFRRHQPEAVVHYAEQPSAPYSMMNRQSASLTLHNNLTVTNNLIHAVHELAPGCHIVKLGTMGEYGTPNIDIEEGWLDVEHKGRRDRFLFPRQASSLYHTTKVLDTDLLWFYVRTWNLRVTDLMQGPVYGVETDENAGAHDLYPFLNYDEIFGTVLNRFMVQAVCGFPLTVYGQGGQTRGYLNIRDTLNCIRLAVENPAAEGEMRIFNQFTETFSVLELADKVRDAGKAFDLDVEVKSIENPRKEREEHYYNPAHTGLLDLGLEPNLLTPEVLESMLSVVLKFSNRIDRDRILKGVKW